MPIYMDQNKVFHKRMIYHFFNLLSDIGGVMEALLGIVAFFTVPIAEHSFIFKAGKRLFKAKTKDSNIFRKGNCKDKESGNDKILNKMGSFIKD